MMLFKLPLYALFIYIVLADVGTATDNAAKTPKSTADATTSTTTTTVAYDTSKSPKADIHSVKYTNSTQTPNTHNVTSGTTQTAKTTSHDTTTITTKPSVRGLIDLPTDFVYAPDSKTPGLHLWTSQKILEPYNIEKVFVLCEPASPNGKSSITPSSPESETNKLIDVFGKEACEKAAKGSGSSRLMGKHIHEGKTRSDPPLKDGLIFSFNIHAIQYGQESISNFLQDKEWSTNVCIPLLKNALKTCPNYGGNATALAPPCDSCKLGALAESRVILRFENGMSGEVVKNAEPSMVKPGKQLRYLRTR